MSFSSKYLPKHLSKKDKIKQAKNLRRSRGAYKQKKYIRRVPLATFVSKKSKHIKKAENMFKVNSMNDFKTLSKNTHCDLKAFEEIISKGKGAYYSSGSRPNQTPESWAYARLASALTGGKSAVVDKDILLQYCHPQKSKSLKLLKLMLTNEKQTKKQKKKQTKSEQKKK